MATVKLSILIVNWNTAGFLRRCLDSLLTELKGYSYEVVVVDNNSADESVEVLREYDGIKVIENNYNFGFAFANNQAFGNSSGEFVMTLNPDTRLRNGAIHKLMQTLENDSGVGIAAPVVMVAEGPPEYPDRSFPLFPESRVIAIFRRLISRPAPPLEARDSIENFDVDWILGTGYICRRAAVRESYLFSADTFLFGEELDLCQRVRESGFRITVVPEAQIEHEKSVTFKYDPERGKTAGTLITVANWNARKNIYGSIPAAASNAYIALDNGLTWVLMTVWTSLKRKPLNRGFLEGYWLGMVVSLKLLFMGERYFKLANKKARLFLNGGTEPPLSNN